MTLSIAEVLIAEYQHWEVEDLYQLAMIHEECSQKHFYKQIHRMDVIFEDKSYIAFKIPTVMREAEPIVIKYGNKWNAIKGY